MEIAVPKATTDIDSHECVQIYRFRCLVCGVRGENIEDLSTLDQYVNQHLKAYPSHQVRLAMDIEIKDVEIEMRTGERRL